MSKQKPPPTKPISKEIRVASTDFHKRMCTKVRAYVCDREENLSLSHQRTTVTDIKRKPVRKCDVCVCPGRAKWAWRVPHGGGWVRV